MFIDACVIVAIMADEDTTHAYEGALATSTQAFTSPMAAWEAIIVLSRSEKLNCRYNDAEVAVVRWLDARNIEIRETGAPRESLSLAVAAAQFYGIGKRRLSNFDCFHYAHAKTSQQPLLTMDRLLRETDVEFLP